MGATIEHTLDLDGSRLSNPQRWAFQAGGAKIGGDVFARNGFEATGGVSLIGSTIGGNLECSGARISNPEGMALMADRASIGGNVYLRPWADIPFTATGEVNFLGATIGGSLECDCAQLTNPRDNSRDNSCENPGDNPRKNPRGYALRADRTKIKGHVFVRDGFKGDGVIDFNGAEIGGSLIWRRVQITAIFYEITSAKIGSINGDKTICPLSGRLELDGWLQPSYNEDSRRAGGLGALA